MGGSAVGDDGYAYRVCKGSRPEPGETGSTTARGAAAEAGETDNYQDSWRGQQGHG